MNQINKKSWVGLVLVIVFLIILLPVLPVAFGFGKTGKNTTVLGRDYSLLSKKEIISRLQTEFPQIPDFTLVYDDRQFTIPSSSVNAQINYPKIASNLLYRRLNQGFINYLSAFFQPKNFLLEVSYDPSILDDQIAQIASQIDRPFVPSELILDDQKKIESKPGEYGLVVDRPLLISQIESGLVEYSSAPIKITANSIGQLPTDAQINATFQKAQALIGRSLNLTGHFDPVTVDDKTLISWLDFTSACKTSSIHDYVLNLANSVKKDPVDAVFKFENNKVLEFMPSAKGYTLSQMELENSLCPQIEKLLADNTLTKVDLALPLVYQDPKLNNSEANNLGIKELIGHGESTFSHSTAIRNFNVQKGAEIVNRILVAPGESFSFVKALGEVTLDAGFKKAYVIRAGKTELDVGGGICQVSTTFFRALLNAGLNITERKNHAYRVSYYEEDMPPGYDATVFIPSPDLKFTNDTGHYVLIQSTYDGVKKKLQYDIYGTSDGRQAEITNYRKWDASPPPPAVYIDDPTLPPGKVIQDEKAIPGLKTAFDWKVTRNGEVIHQKTFTSNFVPWAAVYRRGPALQ